MCVVHVNALNNALLDWKCNEFQRKVCKIYEITILRNLLRGKANNALFLK